MQLKLLSFALFSVALLASASDPFDIDIDALATREWDEDVLERSFDDWDEDVLERNYDDWDDLDSRDFLYDDEDLVGLEARSDEIVNLEEFTTRELVNELSERLFEARAKIPGSAAAKGSKKKGGAQTPGLKPSKKGSAAGSLGSLEGVLRPANDAVGLPAPDESGLPAASSGRVTKAAKAKLDKLLQAIRQYKQRGGGSAAGAKAGKSSSLKAIPGKKGGAKAKPAAQSGSKRKVAAPPSA